MKPESQNTCTRLPSSRSRLRLLGRALDIAGEFVAREVAPDHADAAVAQREHEAGADDAEHHAHEIAEIDDHEHHHHGQRAQSVHERCAGEAASSAENHHAEISEHAAEDRLRHDAADVGAGEQDDGADDADNHAGPARRRARLVEQQATVHRQRAREPADHGREQIGEAVVAKFLVEIGGLLPRHFEARHVEQERDGHHPAHRANFGAALRDHPPIDFMAQDGGDRRTTTLSSPRLGRNQARAHALVVHEAEQAPRPERRGRRRRRAAGRGSSAPIAQAAGSRWRTGSRRRSAAHRAAR